MPSESELNGIFNSTSPERVSQAKSCKLVDEFLTNQFGALDTDLNNFVSKSELDKFLTDNSVSPNDFKACLAARENYSAITALSDDTWGSEEKGISYKDKSAFTDQVLDEPDGKLARHIHYAMKRDERDTERFLSLLHSTPFRLDLDGDGALTIPELRSFASSQSNEGQTRGFANFLLNNFDEINHVGTDRPFRDYARLLPKDNNPQQIKAEELSSLATLLTEKSAFKRMVTDVRAAEWYGATRGAGICAIGALAAAYFARRAYSPFTSAGLWGAAVVGTALVGASLVRMADTYSHNYLIDDFNNQQDKLRSLQYFRF